ncbi:MAG TPA: ABC transporter ATP-binding protein [Spirochaetaceae bacterium]|jgi:biotin transport system ATP-binding protein|nr:ABC transporter ATP-binding protein [Spirochaetaceae bacterium]
MIIEARGLSRVFPDGTRGLDRLELSLGEPGFTLLSGRNGSGKSLFIRHILGLERPDEGGIYIDGVALERCLSLARSRIALLFQEPEHQILGITVREDAEFGPRAAGLKPKAYTALVDDALRSAGLAGMDNRLSSALSGGEKRRLALASVLVGKPELIILDEPFNDLDWQGASDLLAALLRLRKDGIAILIVTHDLEKCLAHADRLIVMEQGRVLRDASPAALWDELPALGLRRPRGGPSLLSGMTWLKAGQQAAP